MLCAFARFASESASFASPQEIISRASNKALGKALARQRKIMQNRNNGAAFRTPLRDQFKKILRRRGVDRAEGFVQKNDAAVLNDQPREKARCI